MTYVTYFFRLFNLESLMKGTNDSHIFLEGLQPGFRLDPRTVSVNRIPVSEVCAATRAALGVWRIDR